MATHRYGATWPMECTSSAAATASAAGTAAAASVTTASRAAERAAHHGFAEVRVCSMTSTSTTARRREEEFGLAGGVFGRIGRLLPGRFDEAYWFEQI